MFTPGYRRLLRIWETNYGRNAGWVAELRGEPIAVLVDVVWNEASQFWFNYRIDFVTEDPAMRAQLLTDEFWAKVCTDSGFGVRLRNREFNEFAPNDAWIAMKSPHLDADRVNMRGLRLDGRPAMAWDRLILWIRRLLLK